MKKSITFKMWGRVFVLPVWIRYVGIGAGIVAAVIIGLAIQNSRKGGSCEVVALGTPGSAEPAGVTASAVVTATPAATVAQEIWVYVVGQVKNPGVYKLNEDAMVATAVEAAGGLTELADGEAINMAAALKGGSMIRVPAVGEATEQWLTEGESGASETMGSEGSSQSGGKVNINTADVQALCTLPGVGKSTAKKIIAYREANGPFGSIEDIMKVPGIKEAKYSSIKEGICVG